MKPIRTLLVTFANDIGSAPIAAFRGAVIEKVGRENPLFHNHLGDDQYIYKYPLIQYKKIGHQPGIFCMDEGVDDIHKLFGHRNWTIDLLGQPLTLKVDRLDMKTTNLNVWQKTFDYTLWNWQALNEANWNRYRTLESMVEKIGMLEKILTGNILSFAKGIGWQIDQPVKVVIRDVKLERNSRMKDITVRTFAVDFRCNVFLPDFMGLGKGVSKGFGTVRQL
ncbi:MAG: hypothetical protein EAY75_06170, partial [Bacteroidetes bacterium]